MSGDTYDVKNKRQVVIINDIKSDKIEQAIFILRDNVSQNTSEVQKYFSKNRETDIVTEAQRIINSFLYPDVYSSSKKDKPKPKVKNKVLVQSLLWLASSMAVVGASVFNTKLAVYVVYCRKQNKNFYFLPYVIAKSLYIVI